MARRYCTKCHFPERTCICALVQQYQSIDYSGEVHVLQHPEEVKQSKNTLALVTQLLPSLKVWVGETESDFTELQQQISASNNQWACFYPSQDCQLQTTEQPDLPSSNVIYIDATWRKARKIWHLNPWLWQVPSFRLNKTPTAKYRIRKNHAPEQLSTLEAIAYSLGNTTNTQALLDLFEQFQLQTEAFSGAVNSKDALQE